jgi:hypothetical protein
MPRKKISLTDITLEDAFSVFERHGLKVKVEAVESEQPNPSLADFLEKPPETPDLPQQVSGKKVKITLHARHTIASSGTIINKKVIGGTLETYGPGIVTVPVELASSLLHQDGLARKADESIRDNRVHTRVIVPSDNGQNRLIEVSQDSNFDLSGLLSALGDRPMYHL